MGDFIFFLFQLLLSTTQPADKKSANSFAVAIVVVAVLVCVITLIILYNPHPAPEKLLSTFKI